jgi:DNA-binding SARP family transcriptional activator
MKLHDLIDQSYQAFLQQLDNTRVILLHPDSRYRSILIAKLINSGDPAVFYYALGPDDINLYSFIVSITHDMANQHPTFGRHINILPQKVYENPQDHFELVLDTFVKDLAELSDEPFLFILDEFDRSDKSDEVQRFVERLGSKLPDHCRMVINSRTLPRLPWISMIAQRRAVLLQDDYIIGQDFYGASNDREDAIEVYTLGPGFVIADTEPVDNWEGHLPRLLFFFALDRPVVTRSEICDAFWPDLDSDQAVNVFHVTKRRLHKALEMDVLVHDSGYYKVNPDLIIYHDAMQFAGLLMQARNSDDVEQKMKSWETAASLYRGPFLKGHNDQWIMERRYDFRAGYLEALSEMASVWIDRGRKEQALALFLKAINADNTREDIHRNLMQLYTDLGRRSEAASHYKSISNSLKLTDETKAFYETLMSS